MVAKAAEKAEISNQSGKASKPTLQLKSLSGVAKMVIESQQKPDAVLKLDKIFTKKQVRRKCENLDELASSIKVNGIIQPIVVHEEPDGMYRVIVGERRFRAAPLAGLDEVPVIIKRGLSEMEIRSMQVTENNDRDGLPPFDEAMGVIEDVEAYGTKGAMKIWNRSEGWISKRIAVKKYLPITFRAIEENLSGDLEILHSLNKIETIAVDVAQQLFDRLQSGQPISRDDVRNKLSMMEQQKAENAAQEKRRKEEEQARLAENAAEESQAKKEPRASDVGSSIADKFKEASKSNAVTAKADSAGKASKQQTALSVVRSGEQAQKDAATAEAAKRERIERNLERLRADLYEYGQLNNSQFKEIGEAMFQLNCKPVEGEWIMWVGFLDIMLPLLDAVGPERAKAYLKKLQGELKGKAAFDVWSEIHPIEKGERADEPNASREQVVSMPKGWTF